MGRKIIIRAGDKYNLLTVIREVEKLKKTRRIECICDCGNIAVLGAHKVVIGHTSSCGCLRNKSQAKPPKKSKMGMLTFLYDVEYKRIANGKRKRRSLFLCDCGTETVAYMSNVVRSHTTSCGCYRKSCEKNKTHGHSGHRAYSRWKAMIDRCYNPDCDSYKHYGARGITVCDQWLESAEAYCTWFDENYTDSVKEVDRRDNEKGYSPDNCRIVNRSVNMTNTRSSVIYEIEGTSYRRTADAEEALGMSIKTIRKRALSDEYPDWKRIQKYD